MTLNNREWLSKILLPLDAVHKRGLCRHAVSVRLSVTSVDSVETTKSIFKNVSPSGSHTILVFRIKRHDNIPTETHNGGVECRWGRKKSRFSTNIWRWIDDCCSTNDNIDGDHAVYRTDLDASVILFITTKMDDHDEEKRTEQNFIVRSGKSEAEVGTVTNNRRLRSMFSAERYYVTFGLWNETSVCRHDVCCLWHCYTLLTIRQH